MNKDHSQHHCSNPRRPDTPDPRRRLSTYVKQENKKIKRKEKKARRKMMQFMNELFKQEDTDDEEKQNSLCDECLQFYFHLRCKGCELKLKDIYRHACENHGDTACPECDTDLSSIC